METQHLLTEEQKDLQAMVRDFADKEIIPVAKECDRTGEFPKELFKKAADMGLTTLSLPEKYGGMGIDNVTYAIIKEELARGDAGFATSLGACFLGVMPIKLYGNDEQMKKMADVLLSGGMTAFGLTEAAAGSDAANLKTTAVKDGDDYILNGTKTFITNGALASLYTIFATVDKSKGAKGISAFIVEAGTPGLSVGKDEDKMGIRTSNTADVILQNVRVPASNMLGQEGEGFKIAMQTLNRTRPTSGAGAIGNARAAYEYALAYSKERVTFGKPVCQNQGVSFMLADMKMQLEAARQLVFYAARVMDAGIVDPTLFSCSKAFASDVGMKVTNNALQILGGFGYSRDYPVEKRFRDAKIYQIFEGTNQIQRVIISGNILK